MQVDLFILKLLPQIQAYIKHLWVCCISLLLTLASATALFSQDFSYRVLDKAHGMPTNTVYDLLQDKRGFVWLGTDKGLYRYDGSEFKLFANQKQDGKSLSNLMEDSDGNIWCQNFSGQFFYTKADSLHFCSQLSPIGSFYQGRILEGRYLLTMGNRSVRVFDIKLQKITRTVFQEYPSPHASTDQQYCYRYAELLSKIIGTSASGKQIEISLPKDANAFYHTISNGKIYFIPKLNATHVSILENGKITDKISLVGASLVQNISQIDQQYLGVYTSSGFYLVDIQSQTKRYFPNIIDKNITAVIKDNEGNFWISTINSGVLFVPSLSMKVIEPKLSFSKLRAIADANTLLFGTAKNEVYQLNLKTLSKQNLHNGYTNDEVVSLHYDELQKRILFSSDKFYQINGQKVVPVGKYAVKDIKTLDKSRVLLAATGFAGTYDWNPQHKIEQFSIGPVRFRSVVIDSSDKSIFLATSDGLWKLDSAKNKTVIKANNETISALELAIRPEKKSTIFAATSTKGIYFIENNRVIKHLTKQSGLEDDGVYRITYYKNQLWWLTERAVQSYDLRTNKIQTFTKADGLPEADLKDLALVNDTVYVATLAGLVSFPTNQASTSTFTPKIILHTFEVNKVPLPLNQQHKLAYDQNNVAIHFSVLSYRSAGELKVYYRINDKAWALLDANARSLNLPELSPDTYHIQLKAINADGVESKMQDLRFIVQKPFWATLWFWTVLLGIIALISYVINNQNLKRLKREAALKAEKLTLEKDLQVHLLTAIKSQMNQHFMYNTLNAIQEQFLYGNKTIASEQLSNFTQLTRQILDVSSKKTIPIATEIEILTKYLDLEKMRFSEGFSYNITLGDTIDEDYHQIPPFLIQPFAENAIRHGLLHKQGDKSLTIHFDLDASEENIICTVKDNGIGRAKADELNAKRLKKFDSFSTSASKERLKLLSGDSPNKNFIEYQDLPEGTMVTITIPI